MRTATNPAECPNGCVWHGVKGGYGKNMIIDKGIAKIYAKTVTGGSGNIATGTPVLKGELWYGERTVGSTRYWNAQVVDQKVDMVVRVLQVFEINAYDTCTLGTTNYTILQAQKLKDEESGEPVYDLSLEYIGQVIA
jgi:hypothetical protein